MYICVCVCIYTYIHTRTFQFFKNKTKKKTWKKISNVCNMLFGLSKELLRKNEREQEAKEKKDWLRVEHLFMGSPTLALLVFYFFFNRTDMS